MKVTSIILAGGKNLRLGRNKALEPINGTSIIERVIIRLKPLSNHMLIVTSAEKVALPALNGVEVLSDIIPGYGPLGGIYTGLVDSDSQYNIVVACDMPFLNTELLRYMIKISADYDAVVPILDNGFVEPLHAIYSRNCIKSLKEQMNINELKVHVLLSKIRVRYIKSEESKKLDPQHLSYFNINRQADLNQAISLAQDEQANKQ